MPWCSNTSQQADVYDSPNLKQLKAQGGLVRRRKRGQSPQMSNDENER